MSGDYALTTGSNATQCGLPSLVTDGPPQAEALRFFKWSLEQGKADARGLNYVPLPDSLVQRIEAYWEQAGK